MAVDILEHYMADPAHMPTKQILNDMTPWPDDASEQFLGTNEVTIIKMASPNSDDMSQPFYIFAKPNGKALWGKQKYPPCRNYPDSCDGSMTALKEYRPKPIVLQDIPHQHHPTKIVICHATYRCTKPGCNKIWWPKFSFADEQAFMTKRLVDLIIRMSFSKRTFQTVAIDTGCPPSVVQDVFKRELKRRFDLPIEAPEHIGIDESTIHTKKGRHTYICLMDTGPNAARNGVLDLSWDSLNADAAEALLNKLQNPDNVKTITMDMSASFHAAAEKVFPHARIIIDRFHVVKSLQDKTKETLSMLYESLKRELEEELNIQPSPSPLFDDADGEDVSLSDLEDENLFDGKSIKDPSVFRPVSGLDAATRYRILKENYHPRWFVTNYENLSKHSAPRFQKLMSTFPEFRNLYYIKETMRYDFYNSKTKAEALAIARKVKALLPPAPRKSKSKVDVYKPLRTFFNTLLTGTFSPHIFEYFNDPVGQRYTNAKLENMNKLVKEVNAAGRGLSLDVLVSKIIYGNLKESEIYRLANDAGILQDDDSAFTPTRYMCFEYGQEHFGASPKAVIERQQRSLSSFMEACRAHTTDAFCKLTDEDWFGVGAACAAQRRGKGIPANTVADIMKLKDAFVSGRIFEDDALYWEAFACAEMELGLIAQAHGLTLVKVKEECRLPFLLKSWEAHKNEYLAMVADDSLFLEDCGLSTPDL